MTKKKQTESPRCPFCRNRAELYSCDIDCHMVQCVNIKCGMIGPVRKTKAGAIQAWERILVMR